MRIKLEKLNNLNVLDFSNNMLNEIKGLKELNTLTKLDFNDNRIKEIKGLENLKNLNCTEYLTTEERIYKQQVMEGLLIELTKQVIVLVKKDEVIKN
jgi:internalin A